MTNNNVILMTGRVSERKDEIKTKGSGAAAEESIERKLTLKVEGGPTVTVDLSGNLDLFEKFPAGQHVLFEITPVDVRPEEPVVEAAPEIVAPSNDLLPIGAIPGMSGY